MFGGRLHGKFVYKNVINLSKQCLTENEISPSSKVLNFTKLQILHVARLKIGLGQSDRMLRLKWHFRNDKRDIPINSFKRKLNFNTRNKDATTENIWAV